MEGRAGAGTRREKQNKTWPGLRSVFSSFLESLKKKMIIWVPVVEIQI